MAVNILGACPIALSQGRFTYSHNQVLNCSAIELSKLFPGSCILLYADLPGLFPANNSTFFACYSMPVIYNRSNNSLAMMELTCPLDSVESLQSARECKQGKGIP